MPIGFKINQRSRKVDPTSIAAFGSIPVANISDSMSRLVAGGARLRPLHAGGGMAGPAFTVKTRPGDNLMVHKALDLADPGDVVVVDAGGELSQAIVGDLMLSYAIKRGLAGVVINGAIRDLDFVAGQRFPVYAAGVTHRGPYKDGPGEINGPIAIDGMVIQPGELVLGDMDGLLCVPFDMLAEVLVAAQAKQRAEASEHAAIEAGRNDRSWVDATLRRLGCEM